MKDVPTSHTLSAQTGDAGSVPVSAPSLTNLDDTTGAAPPYCDPLTTIAAKSATEHDTTPKVGAILGDFELLRLLGGGGFGKVYLARQRSLNREVALKVTANRGEEARTLARLEHDHIVQVFAEVVDAERNLRLLCMQYVPGTTLARVIDELARRPRAEWSGRAILEIIDAVSAAPAALDAAALRDREFLAGCDFIEAACWIGARLAEALAHAHQNGVLHRDVKPANILLSRYGRPYLADFNVSSLVPREGETARQMFGGTLAYMAPEHLAAFLSGDAAERDAVGGWADVYAFGVVLYELLVGRLPFQPTEIHAGKSKIEVVRSLLLETSPGWPARPYCHPLPRCRRRPLTWCSAAWNRRRRGALCKPPTWRTLWTAAANCGASTTNYHPPASSRALLQRLAVLRRLRGWSCCRTCSAAWSTSRTTNCASFNVCARIRRRFSSIS